MQTGHLQHKEGEEVDEEVNFFDDLMVCFKNIFCVKSMNVSGFHLVYLGASSADDAEYLM